MEFKYKLLQQEEGYKIVEFQHSFYNGLKKSLAKQSNKYFKMLNPLRKKREMYTVVPHMYNHDNVKSAMIIQNVIDNEAIGIIVDETDNNAVFDRISATLSNGINDFCPFKMNDTNIIICPDDVNSVAEIKKIINKEFVKFKLENTLKEKNFSVEDISKTEQDFIHDELEDMIIEMLDNDVEVSEELTFLTQFDLCKVISNKKKMREVQKLFELLGITVAMIENAFYFEKRDKLIVNEYVNKLFNNEIVLSDRVYEVDKSNNITAAIEAKTQEKHTFKFKSIDEYIKSKRDLGIQSQNEPEIQHESLEQIQK